MRRDTTNRRQTQRHNRGQTTQDFVMGIGVFLITLTFVFGFFPQLMSPYDAGAGAEEASLASRSASTVLSEIETVGAKNDVNSTKAAEYFDHNLSEQFVHANLTLPDAVSVNVTIRTLDRSRILEVEDASGTIVPLAGGDDYDNQSAVALTRVITMENDSGACKPACRIVVLVW